MKFCSTRWVSLEIRQTELTENILLSTGKSGKPFSLRSIHRCIYARCTVILCKIGTQGKMSFVCLDESSQAAPDLSATLHKFTGLKKNYAVVENALAFTLHRI
ncbi:hypothetical protein AVEN_108942-1 [Araneus ventricosus]|uniref:Uncharacterized protein n=1 Tax=Araneus ventricosus TaxID=182803 RepID=A0A4Y2F600_ARAVE|nr:hypothetical protein AVEN_108942-1 [Araneus ventricosus]